MTDADAVRLVEAMRLSTNDMRVAELCDWVLGLVRREAAATALLAAPVEAKAIKTAQAKENRRAYMKIFMARKRAARRRAREKDAGLSGK